jgi:hypothetical protein
LFVVQYDQTYDPQFIEEANTNAAAGASTSTVPQAESTEKSRGRKRTRTQVGLFSSPLEYRSLIICLACSCRASYKFGGEQEPTSTIAYASYTCH